MKPARILEAERLYSIDEAAALWSVSRDTIERLLAAGKLRHVSIGDRRRRIPASALEEYSSANRAEGTK